MAQVRHNLPYDSRVHITAGQLRRLGFYLCEMLPNNAYVRRVAVDLDPDEPLDDGTSTLRLNLYEDFAVPQPQLVAV